MDKYHFFALSEVSDEGCLMTVLYIATNTLMFMVVHLRQINRVLWRMTLAYIIL